MRFPDCDFLKDTVMDYNEVACLDEVYIMLHMGCELKCKVCPYWGIRGACRNDEFLARHKGSLSTDNIIGFIDQVIEYRPKTITLSGGEPMADPRWVRIAEHIKSKGCSLSVVTNGLYLHEYLDKIWLIDNLIVSIGGTKDILRDIRDADFGFDRVIDALGKVRGPFIRIICVICDKSYRRLRDLYSYLKQRMDFDDFYLQHVMFLTEDELEAQKEFMISIGQKSDIWEGYLSEQKFDYDELFIQLDWFERKGDVTISPRFDHNEIKLYYAGKLERDKKCEAPWRQVDLYPNGDIMVCPDYVIGNICDESFDKIWNGKKINQLRQNPKMPGCKGCFYYYMEGQ